MRSNFFYFIIFLLSSFVISSCSQPEYPEFQKIKNISIKKLKANKVVVGADAVINNPNVLGATIVSSNIEVLIQEKHKAKVKQFDRTEIPANSDFEMPMQFEFSPKEIWKSDLLGSALSILGNKKVDAHFTGTIKVDVAGVEIPIPVDYQDSFPLKQK